MATEPAHRGRGHARRIMHALLLWFGERGVGRIELNATSEGEPLYRSLGFTEPDHPVLTFKARR